MPEIPISQWSHGLDTRRSQLTSVPGTLLQVDNAHINQGAEVEKRKAFVKTLMPPGTFGAQPTPNTIYVFGSSSGINVPPGFTYQQLQAPSGAAMTGVVDSTLFANNPFVVAQFADGQIYAFYNGALVTDFIAGQVNIFPNNANIASGLAALVNASGQYTAIYNNGSVGVDTFDVFSIPNTSNGNPYTETITLSTVAGTLTATNISAGSASTSAGIATGSFQIVAGVCDVQGTLTSDGTNVSDGDAVTLGATTYTFKTTPTTNNQVKIGVDAPTSLANLNMAVMASGTAGTNYFSVTAANTSATMTPVSTTVVKANAIVSTSVAASTTAAHLAWTGLSGGNLLAGTTNYVSSIKVGALEILGVNVPFAKDLTTTITNVVNQILSYSAANPDGSGDYFTASASGSTITLSTNVGTATYNGAVITVTGHGFFLCDNCVFSITGTSFTCDFLNVGGVNIMSAVLTFPTNTEQLPYFAQRICENVNAGSSGYKAVSQPGTAVIYLSKAITQTTDSIFAVQASLTGVAGGGTGTSGPLSGTFAPSSLTVSNSGIQSGIVLANGDQYWVVSQPLTVTPVGGVPPYDYTYTLNTTAQWNSVYVSGVYRTYGGNFGVTSSLAYIAASGWSPSNTVSPPSPLGANNSSDTIIVFLPLGQFFASEQSAYLGIHFSGVGVPGSSVAQLGITGYNWAVTVYNFVLTIQIQDSTGATGVIGSVPFSFYVGAHA